VAEVVECLPGKCEALSSNPVRKRERKRKRERERKQLHNLTKKKIGMKERAK
jgi:hypothetical protein